MSKSVTRKHWYDGKFYAFFIDGTGSTLRRRIFKYIEPGKSVIDIGCGSGGVALQLAAGGRRVVGVDISGKMIAAAKQRQKKAEIPNIRFIQAGANEIGAWSQERFDYALFSFFLHEIDHPERIEILRQANRIAEKIIILDYYHPQPAGPRGRLIQLIERFTSPAHYRNYRDFLQRGGLIPLLAEAGLQLQQSTVNRLKLFQVVVAVEK